MALIPYADVPTLPSDAQTAVTAFEAEHGRRSMGRRMLAQYLPLLHAMDTVHDSLMQGGTLSRQTKELLFVAASAARGCHYSAGGHSRFLVQHYHLAPETVVRLRNGEPVEGWDPVVLALIAFVRQAAVQPEAVSAETMAGLAALGIDHATILEALSMAMLSAMTFTLAKTLKFADDLPEWGLDHEYF